MNPVLLSSILIAFVGTFVFSVLFTILFRLLEFGNNFPFIALISLVVAALLSRSYYTRTMPKITTDKPKFDHSLQGRASVRTTIFVVVMVGLIIYFGLWSVIW